MFFIRHFFKITNENKLDHFLENQLHMEMFRHVSHIHLRLPGVSKSGAYRILKQQIWSAHFNTDDYPRIYACVTCVITASAVKFAY